jgi:mannose/cellobiose epimerase-like protein (N-acyl-D-glucosamine 2-epimerase family)
MTRTAPAVRPWADNAFHQRWLLTQAEKLLDFFIPAALDPAGGFRSLDIQGRPRASSVRDLIQTARLVHCYALADLLGRPAAAGVVEHGLTLLRGRLRDADHGGWFWTATAAEPVDRTKQAYGHAFVLLAASSALQAGFAARDLLEEATRALEERFWLPSDGLYAEEFHPDWSPMSRYRGGNSNMHLVEALLAARDATGDDLYLQRAESVATRLIWEITRANDWRLAEHYTEFWVIDTDYSRDDPRNTYRPYGSVIGHSPEWARLLLGLRTARGADSWYVDAARSLFDVSVPHAWDSDATGLAYTVDFDGTVLDDDHYQWPVSEAIGAAHTLRSVTGDPTYETWYRKLWRFADEHLIDRERGGWYYVLDARNAPKEIPGVAEGKPDLYHALQSCLIPLLPPGVSVAEGVRRLAS